MGRKKQEITKETRMQLRIEKELKNNYILTCKRNKLIYSERIRKFIINDLKEIEND